MTRALPAPANATARPCEALLKLRPARIDRGMIAALVGDGVVPTQAAVAREFGLAANTVKQSWATAGMPGEQGRYSLADITAWRLRYLEELEGRKQSAAELSNSELERQQAEEELRKIKLQNDKMEMEVAQMQGKLIGREDVLGAWKTDNAVLVERIKKLPRMKWATMLNQDQAAKVIPVFEEDLDREFIAHSEGRVSEVVSPEDDIDS